MTGRTKAALALALALLIAGSSFLAGWRMKARLNREAELAYALRSERLRAGAAVAEMQAEPPSQKTAWRDKGSGKKVKTPKDCASCLAQVKREVEVKDEAQGWWVYHDPDVLDEEAGELTLTPRFFQDIAPANQGNAASIVPDRKTMFAPPETSLRAGLNLTSYELEFSYAPLVLESPRARLSLDLRSRLTLNRYDSDLRGDLGAGVEIRW